MKKKLALVFCVVALIYIAVSTVCDNIEYSKMSLEEKVMRVMSVYALEGSDPYVDKIHLLEKVDGGYIGVGQSTVNEEIHFAYMKDGGKKLEHAGMTISPILSYIHRKDPSKISVIVTQPLKDQNWYFGCYQHADNVKVKVNGEEVPIYNFKVDYKGKNYNMDFWFVRCEDEPTVELK